jgi:hypothetical protein
MKNSLLQHALNSLAHPVSIGAAIFLLFNALIWQRFWPSWWTGKIGDFAWMVIGPFLVVLLLVLCLPTFFRDDSFVGISAVFITGAGFGLLKIWLPLNTLVTTWLGNLGFTLKLSADPSDLIVLPGLLIALFVWRNSRTNSPGKVIRLGALLLAAFAVVADSPYPPPGYRTYSPTDYTTPSYSILNLPQAPTVSTAIPTLAATQNPQPGNQEAIPGLAGKWIDWDSSGGGGAGTETTIEWQNGEYIVSSVIITGTDVNEVTKSSWSNGVLTWEYCPIDMHCTTQHTVMLNGENLTVDWARSDGGNSGQKVLQRYQ